MEFGAATTTLTKKLSNGYGVSGRSAYDGVFATPIKLRAPSFSSQFDDYREIFGSSSASLGSSIPILELPELNERKARDDVRRSKLDYSKVFGGFGNLAAAVPFEELVAAPKQNDCFTNGASARSKVKGEHQSCQEDRPNYSKEIPVVSQSSEGAKRINMSYHKVNQGSENGANGTTHIAQIHAVSAYTRLIEEVNPVKLNRANKPIPVVQDTNSGNLRNEGIKEGGHCTRSFTGAPPDNAKKQSSNNGVKIKNRSNSVDLFFDACEISSGSNGTQHVDVHPSETMACNLDNHNSDAMRSMPIKCQTSKSGTSQSAAGADSPSYFDDMVDSNSEAAASVAALTKAIEEAQVRMKVAKESLRRKKEGFPDRVKRNSNIDLKAEGKEGKLAYKTMKIEEIKVRKTFREMDALPEVSYEVGKPTMRMEQGRSDLGAKEMCPAEVAVREEQRKLKSTQAERKEEVEQKADHKGKVLEFEAIENNKKLLYSNNTSKKASDKPKESNHTIEVIKENWEQENNEVEVRADNEAGACDVVHETKHNCQEVVDETKMVQETLDNGTMYKRLKLKINEDGEFQDMMSPIHEPEDYESNLGRQGLGAGDERKVSCDPEEDCKKVEGSFQLEECEKKLSAIEELEEVKKNIAQEQKVGSEDEFEVSSSELEECELTEFLKPMKNETTCSQHGSDLLLSLESGIENLGCLEDRKRRDESGFLDIHQETEHTCQNETVDHTFSNISMHEEILEDVLDHIHDEEEIYERITIDSGLNGNGRVQDAQASESELEGICHVMAENEREGADSREPVDIIGVTQTDPNYEETKATELGKTTETSSSYEPDETQKLSKTQVAGTIIENDETLEVTPEVFSCYVHDDIMVASIDSFQHHEKNKELESVQETNNFCEEHADQTSAFTEGADELNEAVNEMQNTFETVPFEGAATNIGETEIKIRQNQEQCMEKEVDLNLTMLVEEATPESVETCMDSKEARVELNEEIDENRSNSSNEEILFDNEHDIEASQIPSTSEWKQSSFKEEVVESIHSNLKESHQASMTMEEKEADDNLRKVQLELRKKLEAKVRDREREKEKLAVERAIREARERAFADARERAALGRAAAEACQKNASDRQERLGKTTSQANEKTLAAKAALEAKIKAERAAVERATAEARARALERALSEKAASEARNKSDKSIAQKLFGSSRDNGMKQNFHSKSFSHGVRDSNDVFGANCNSAQRCKARSERHQRIGERVAKALAEKNMRDRLVQKEQEERNRVAEALDADVKRWSSGKAGNLRALLSTLQYILGPDSGWQPIPLTDIVTTTAVKKAYRKATLFVHPDKLQQRRASIQQKYICEKVFDLLKEAWNRFNMEER